jgi:hypothetical protein
MTNNLWFSSALLLLLLATSNLSYSKPVFATNSLNNTQYILLEDNSHRIQISNYSSLGFDDDTLLAYMTLQNDSDVELEVDVDYADEDTLEKQLESESDSNSEDLSKYTEIESSVNSSLGNFPAYKLVYTYTDEDGVLSKVLEIGTIVNDRVITISYEAPEDKYSAYLSKVMDMANTLIISSK